MTGAAKRLGRAVALALAEHGVDVVVHYNTSRGQAESVANAIRGLDRQAWTVEADLADAHEAEDLFHRAAELAGPIDILVNNASIFPADRVGDFGADDLARAVQVNAYAPLALARAMAGQSRPGSIVNFLDCRIVDYDRDHASYHLSKRMLFALTRMLALELAPAVRVNAVAPGLILPPEGQDEGYLKRLASTNPLNRHGGPEDIVAAVLFLTESDFVTGQVLFVDGGRHLKGRVHD